MKNSVIKRIVYAVKIRLDSPLCVSGGQSEQTDTDVQRDFDGRPFVPGTTLAGALRDCLIRLGEDTSVFGEEGSESRMSPVRISDLRFEGEDELQAKVRDGVRLENKLAVDEAKYDMEILESGCSGSFRLELTVRELEREKEDLWEAQIGRLLSALEDGSIRLGANKNRGFGRIRICEVYRKAFDCTNVGEWLAWSPGQEGAPDEWKKEKWYQPEKELFVTFRIRLRLKGGISIRRYSTKPDGPNFEHLTCGGEPVIPGTSWNGAIRSRAGELLYLLGCPSGRIEAILQEWFGYVDTKKGKREGAAKGKDSTVPAVKDKDSTVPAAKQSQIVISESRIEGGTDLEQTRNKISRFEASTVESALYSEKAHFEGRTELEIKVRREMRDCMAACGLMLLTVKEIENGYLAVGGQTAVGRGIFEGKDSQAVPQELQDSCMRALNRLIKEQRRDAGC